MAEQDNKNYDYIEEVPPELEHRRDLLQSLFVATPPWLFSFVIHAVMFVIMFQIAWDSSPKEQVIVTADIIEPEQREEEERVEPEQPDIPEESDIVNPNLPPADEIFMPEVVLDQPDIDVPGFNLFDPDDDPPLAVEVMALGDQGASGFFHGVYGARGGQGRRRGLMRGGGSKASEKSVEDGLAWLARAQEPEGHWDCQKWGGKANHDAAMTGLALLAFLGHGETDRDGKYRGNVRRALQWLKDNQKGGGWPGNFYTQGICLMASSEAYGLTKNNDWREMAQKAVDYCLANQNPNDGGWNYGGITPNRVDTSVTAWVLLGVKSAIASGLRVEQKDIDLINKWCKETLNADGKTGYTKNIGGGGSSNGTPPMTAASTIARVFYGWSPDELQKSFDYIHGVGPDLGNLYYTYYGTLTMFQAGGKYWEAWNQKLRDPLIARQVKDHGPEFDGSWDHEPTRYGKSHAGRVWSTAVSIMCLEIYYRYLPILR